MSLDKQALRDAVIALIEEQGWRNSEESYDYGYGGESYTYNAMLDRTEIEPVADKILVLIGASYIDTINRVLSEGGELCLNRE